MLPRARRRKHAESTDIDLTPYMNLLVVLAPFLLVTAVFERLAALEIYLPQPTAAEAAGAKPPGQQEDQLLLTISIAEKGILVANGAQLVALAPPTETGYDLSALSSTLQQLKSRYPSADSAVILSKGNVAYETLVAVMDTAREAWVTVDGKKKRYILFSNISLGEVQ
jgi:biopolymer transport protein ExbD